MARVEWMGVRVIDPQALVPDPAALALLPRSHAERAPALPLLLRDEELVVLVDDPLEKAVLDELRFVTQRRIVPVMALPQTLMPAIRRAYGADADPVDSHDAQNGTGDARSMADALMAAPEGADDRYSTVVAEADSALVRLINSVIAEAIARRASDIHIETAESPRHVRIRLRIDGEMLPFVELPARLRFAIVARLKIMAELDISEHRRPQDGKIDFARFGGSHVELRVVTVPTSRGLEDVVLRLLSGLKPRPLDAIDLSAGNLASLRAAALKPYGLILICGPTGCGKTTTLHSVMRELNTGARKIWTAEDPIEITQEGLRQVQINPHIGWTFAAAMRTFLRADPDVIMIGEMRDEETARIAIDASLTGHLVLSTLHTNSAPESIARLLEIGLDPFNFSDSLLAILAQRLVRRLCTACREAVAVDADELETMAGLYLGPAADAAQRAALKQGWRAAHADAQGHVRLLRRRGCAQCDGHGYSGRLAIHELMLADDAIRAHVRHREAASVLQAAALAAGMKTLRQDGIDKVLAGLTDMSEVLSATQA
jgi:type II secretory ATPase GspE/PulE/Tfp pilus assembly ATPase PilB-like protein